MSWRMEKKSATSDELKPDNKVSFGYEEVSPREKEKRVEGVFSSVAKRYDLMNDAMSFRLHRAWKANLIDKLAPQPGQTLLDVAGGTGDIAAAFIKRANAIAALRAVETTPQTTRAIVADYNLEMLQAGQQRGEPFNQLQWLCADGGELPLKDNEVDCISIVFGIRNFADRMQGLRDMYRVLKPGGKFICLEMSTPNLRLLKKAYDFYSFNVIPRMGKILTGDQSSYQYFVESIRRFPAQEAFAKEIREAGFSRVKYSNFAGGVTALHQGWKL